MWHARSHLSELTTGGVRLFAHKLQTSANVTDSARRATLVEPEQRRRRSRLNWLSDRSKPDHCAVSELAGFSLSFGSSPPSPIRSEICRRDEDRDRTRSFCSAAEICLKNALSWASRAIRPTRRQSATGTLVAVVLHLALALSSHLTSGSHAPGRLCEHLAAPSTRELRTLSLIGNCATLELGELNARARLSSAERRPTFARRGGERKLFAPQ